MQYNYPLTTDSIESIKDVFDSSNSQGFIQSLSPGIAVLLFIISCILILFILLFFADEWIKTTFTSLIVSFIAIVALFVFAYLLYGEHIAGGGQETKMKNKLISATADSWQNKEEYIKFQSNMGRYLESQNIDIEKNCKNTLRKNDTLEIDDSQKINKEPLYNDFFVSMEISETTKRSNPNNTIICDNESRQLAGIVEFIDNNGNTIPYKYNTSVNQEDGYAIFNIEKE